MQQEDGREKHFIIATILTTRSKVNAFDHTGELINSKQAQLRLCKLGLGTVFLISFFSAIEFFSGALLSQASLVVGCMLTSTYDFQAKSQLPT